MGLREEGARGQVQVGLVLWQFLSTLFSEAGLYTLAKVKVCRETQSKGVSLLFERRCRLSRCPAGKE